MEPDKEPLSPSAAHQRLATPGVLDAEARIYADDFTDVETASITGRSEYSTDVPQAHGRRERRLSNLSSGSFSKRDQREALSPLVNLVEMLKEAEYSEDEDDMDDDESLLSGSQPRKSGKGRYQSSSQLLTNFTDIVRKRQREDSDEEVEYCAPPFTEGNMDLKAALLSPEPNMRGFENVDDDSEDGDPIRRYKRKRRINILGMSFFVLYLIMLCFYLWVRFTKTLGLGSWQWYGVLILVGEILGATTTIIYGLNLIMYTKKDPLPMDPDHPGLTKVDMAYTIRVLVPCYKEDTDIVAATVKAACNAALPMGCKRAIYILDDGKDPTKRKLFTNWGPDVIYVSGRKRAGAEINGKSNNLNNCLRQIYPEGMRIPANELVCIFDADQIPNRDFFVKTIYLFDGGDDVGMVLSPQYFHNISPGADIFNHGNTNFWDYAQPGYDALNFISCTGTNFLARSRALEEAGWSPDYTLTEDYALGMNMKMYGWKCRYVSEVLAIGEAPEQVRNCFQQRSRWSKGHFQIVLSSEYCPLFQPGLSWFDRIMYCTGVWAYLVGGITSPMFTAVPLITIWAGIFPIVVNWWAAVALTAYMGSQYLVLNYMRSRSHVMPLWFNGIANAILWFTFIKAFWRSVLGFMGKAITFKTTLKGVGARMAASTVGDLWLPTLTLLFQMVTFIFGVYKVANGPSVVTTLTISLVWILYGMIPNILLMYYVWVGHGHSLQITCKIMYLISMLCTVCAIVLVWLVYPQEYDFSSAVNSSLSFYDTQKVGKLPADNPIPWRGDSLLYETGNYPTDKGFKNVTGGWMNGGIAGSVKLTMPTALSTAMLAWGLLSFPEGHAKANSTAKTKEQIRWGTDYLLQLFAVDPKYTVKGKYTAYNIIYQVGNWTDDITWWGRPEDITTPRPVYMISTRNGTSDVGSQMIGAFVSASMVFEKEDPEYATLLMNSALMLYGAITPYPGRYTVNLIWKCGATSTVNPIIVGPKPDCKPPETAFNGSMAIPYNSTSYRDDLTWAAAWMYKKTKDPLYMADAYDFWEDHVAREGDFDVRLIVDWDHMLWPATFLLAEATGDLQFHWNAQNFLRQWLCSSGETIQYTQQQRAWNKYSPSIGTTMNAAFLSMMYGQLIEKQPANLGPLDAEKYVDPAKAQRYTCWARTQVRYVLGDKGRSFMVGFGKEPPLFAQDRAATCPSDEKCTKTNSLFSDNPNPHVSIGALVEKSIFNDILKDSRDSNDTRVSIENNAGFTSVLAGLNQDTGSYSQCLQGFGVFTKDKIVCGSAVKV